MNTATTSPGPANSLAAEWSRFGSFLKHPHLPGRSARARLSGAIPALRLLVLDILVMAALLAVGGLAMSVGVDLPETALSGVDLGAAIVFAVVVVAPIAEELLFRGWLSGRPGHVLAILLILGGGLVLSSDLTRSDAAINLKAIGVAVASLLGAALALILLRRREPLGWFRRVFPVLFWLSCALFAAVHILNFAEENMLLVLPLVLPQFAVGTMLGYLRVTYGLWTSILLHMLHNGAFVALVLLASRTA